MILKTTAIFVLIFLFNQKLKAQHKDVKVIAYFNGNVTQLDSFDVNKITHLIFCFGHLNGASYNIDKAEDTLIIQKMVSLKSKNPALKILLSLGGWGGCETCSDAFSTNAGRSEFAASVKHIINYFKVDGIDLDWEYPTIRLDNDVDKEPVHKTSPEDNKNFTALVKELRNVLGKNAIISFAAGAFNTYLQKSIDWDQVMPYVNFVNLMSYDLVNGYATTTGHHTALYSTPQQKESTDNAVQYLIKIGVDPAKIIIGAAFYARVWADVPPVNNGLYQQGKFKEGFSYKDFPARMSKARGYDNFWDDVAQAPYSYNAAEKKFATYDDKRSIHAKTKYVLAKKLGGIMFWEISGDATINSLVDEIHHTIINVN